MIYDLCVRTRHTPIVLLVINHKLEIINHKLEIINHKFEISKCQ